MRSMDCPVSSLEFLLEFDENMTVAFRATVFHFQPAILVSQQKDKECGLLRAAESEVRYEEGFDRDCIYY